MTGQSIGQPTRPVRVGMLTPSSNTVLEPATAALVAGAEAGAAAVSVHVARFRVTEIALSEGALEQFTGPSMLAAAELLADARVDVIAWNGTSAGWLGFNSDEQLCERITGATGIPACTTTLAYREILNGTGVTRLGLVTPYTPDVLARIVQTFGTAGITCAAERHLALRDNFSFATVPEAEVARLVRAVAREGCEAVAIFCTNMRGAGAAAGLEAELGLPVYDSVAVTLWKCLAMTGVDMAGWRRLGRLFALPATVAGKA